MGSLAEFIAKLRQAYPEFEFKLGQRDHWSPRQMTIFYSEDQPAEDTKIAILHELSHALLEHKSYSSDFELLQMESEAWGKAKELAKAHRMTISDDHIEDCVDSYRDWLHRRSQCPACTSHGLQISTREYRCPNCQTAWQVTPHRFNRPYRLSKIK